MFPNFTQMVFISSSYFIITVKHATAGLGVLIVVVKHIKAFH